jgi:RNA polymerase sigma factor (sigma-70 family)
VSTTDVIVSESICAAALVSEARAGNHNAFDELCRRYSSGLMGSIRRLLRDRWDAEDALQETFLSVFTHLKSFQARSSVSIWMTRVAVNAALSRLRKSRGTAVSIDEAGEESGMALSSVLQDGALGVERRLIHAQQERPCTSSSEVVAQEDKLSTSFSCVTWRGLQNAMALTAH